MTESRSHYLPLRKNKNFIGRERVIADLRRLLFTDPDGQRVALYGLGGVGKTQIAIELAHIVKKQDQVDQVDRNYSVIWMPALSMASFEQACTKMISEVGIKRANDEDPKETFRRFLNSEKAGKWFLIIDNADNIETLYGTTKAPSGIDKFIPESENGCILYTTRSREVAISVAQNNVVKLSEMDDKDAKALLQGSLIEKDQMQDTALVDELLHKLAYLPLAITQASAYMKVNEISVKEYLHLLQSTNQDMVELLSCGFRDSTHYDASQGAVATTWIVSFQQIRSLHEDAATILSCTACLEPKAIPRALIPPLDSEQRMTRALGTLCGYSFLSKREDGETFDMHSLVHLATQLWSEEEGLETETRQMVFLHIAEVFPYNDWEKRELWQQYMPHALRLVTNTDGAEPRGICLLGDKVSRCLVIDGQTRQAVHILESVVEVQKKVLAENDPDRLTLEHELAFAYRRDGQMKQAIELLEYVVAMRADLAENSPSRLTSQHELASAYTSNGQTKQAIELLEHVVEMRADLAENNPDRLASLYQLALAYHSNGQIKEAIELLEHVVAIEADSAENNPKRLASQHELASAYTSNGRIKEAIKLLKHIIAVQADILVEDHPDQLTSKYSLGVVYQDNGQTKEAIELLEHVVTMETDLAENNPSRLASENSLGVAYLENGQTKEAIELLEHVVTVQAHTLAEDHPDRLASEHSLGVVYQDNGQTKEAIELLEHVVAMETDLAENNPSRLASENSLGVAYLENGQTKEAIELLEHVVTVRAVVLPGDNPRRQESIWSLQYSYDMLEKVSVSGVPDGGEPVDAM
ncbi:hypothetical protein BFJ72_g10541 [Fusarium proliferatum]|uniref:NB-ARC domain-containing protein n=1 Tax=Gibberella intermedia TaxID=948311 RepID=A0A420STM7_GIBIN|nr:hypothetical protein BFJ72_g10541 [Fusarium proliferatum]